MAEDDQDSIVTYNSDSPEAEPKSSGSSGKQEPSSPGSSIVRLSDDTDVSHIGALLGQKLDSGSPFLRAVAYAALKDAEASRRFLEYQLQAAMTDSAELRERTGTAERQVAVLKTLLGERSSQRVVFAIGAAIVGSGLSVALVQDVALWHVVVILVGIAVMFFSRGSGSPEEDR